MRPWLDGIHSHNNTIVPPVAANTANRVPTDTVVRGPRIDRTRLRSRWEIERALHRVLTNIERAYRTADRLAKELERARESVR